MDKVTVLLKHEYDDWLTLCNEYSNPKRDGIRRAFLAESGCGRLFVFRNNGKIACCIRLCIRRVSIFGTVFQVGIIGDFCSHPQLADSDMKREALCAAIKYLDENGIVISVIKTDDRSLAEEYGWRILSAFNRVVNKKYLKCKIVPVQLDTKCYIEKMQLLYSNYTATFDFCPDRYDRYSEKCIYPNMKNVYGVFDNGELAGYTAFSDNECTEIISPEKYRESLLTACPPDNDGCIKMSTEIHMPITERIENAKRGLMIRLASPMYFNQAYISTSELLSAYLQENKFLLFSNDEI